MLAFSTHINRRVSWAGGEDSQDSLEAWGDVVVAT